MMRKFLFLPLLFPLIGFSQSNISIQSGPGLAVMQGNYNPASYAATNVIDGHDQIICEINNLVSPDSLLANIEKLVSFQTRHTFSDTLSNTRGTGAARRWIHQKFTQYSGRNENRLLATYLKFDWLNSSCGDGYDLKNVLAILPGTDTSQKEIILVEAHMDSRCEQRCDTNCFAPGADDNGSGTALVMELARVMSRYSFEHTIVFMTNTGEEQGLLGATAMAQYAVDNGIAMKAVQNNDVVGGVICGETSSPPGCAPPDAIDSTHLRIYANPISYFNPHQSFARTVKMYYQEKLKPNVQVPMTIDLIDQEDRVGRGGDHIPFREKGFRNLRFTEANEHGDASPDTSYSDRQHSTRDILGLDTDGDGKIDSFFVDKNYLARNTVINGMSLTLLAQGPNTPEFTLHNEPTGLRVEVLNPTVAQYRVGVRDGIQIDFNALYRFSAPSFLVPGQVSGDYYYISVAALDSNGVMSPFTTEKRAFSAANTAAGTPDNLPFKIDCSLVGANEFFLEKEEKGIRLGEAVPNPLKNQTTITVEVSDPAIRKASLVIYDAAAKTVDEIPLQLELELGPNEVRYRHEAGPGVFYYSLKVNGQVVETRKMVVQP